MPVRLDPNRHKGPIDPVAFDYYSGHCQNRIRIPVYKLIRVKKGEPPPEKCPHCGRPWKAIKQIAESTLVIAAIRQQQKAAA